jgi:hypothetical protein
MTVRPKKTIETPTPQVLMLQVSLRRTGEHRKAQKCLCCSYLLQAYCIKTLEWLTLAIAICEVLVIPVQNLHVLNSDLIPTRSALSVLSRTI